MANIWNLLLFHPLVNVLVWFTTLTGNLGWAIIVTTIALRFLMTPLVVPSLKMSKKMQELAPELAKLKSKHKDDKQALALAQAALYKQAGINPASGCLPQIIQLIVLIALFNALNLLLKSDNIASTLNPILYVGNKLSEGVALTTHFWYLNLNQPDTFRLPGLPIPLPGLFLILSAVTQLLSSLMLMPAVIAEKKVASATPSDTDDAMVAAQQQMMYLFPLMTLVIGFQFPSGLVLYWLVFSAVSMLQQYLTTGWGGLTPYLRRLNLLK